MKVAEPEAPPVDRTPNAARRGLLPDVLFLLLLGAFWAYTVTPIVSVEKRQGGDILRDVASAINVRHGQVFADPAYRGETIWYPPLSSMIVAAVSSLLNITPTDCYLWSQLLFNWMIPAGLCLVVRLQWGRRAAMASTVALLLAVPWWQTSVCRGQPSVHAVVWGWAALLLYGWQHRRASLGWAVACGLLQGVAFWHHPLLPAVLGAGFIFQAGWGCLGVPEGPDRRGACSGLRREALILGLTLMVAAPILYLMQHGPVLNPEPREYLADELRTGEFPLMRYNVWIWATGLIGLISSARGRDVGSRLLVVAMALCILGQLPGYARILDLPMSSRVPVVVPHEFQLVFQLGWAICVGVGIDAVLTFLAARVAFLRVRRTAVGVLTLLALVLTGAWGLPDVRVNLRRFLHHYGPGDPAFRDAAEWIRRNTDVNDLFMCEADWAFAWLSPETGRKVWVTGHGHGNPRVDWHGRVQTLEQMRALTSPRTFWRMARERGVDYCIPSPGWLPRILSDPTLGPIAVPAYLEPVHVSGKIHILKVVPKPAAPSRAATDSRPPDR